MSLVGQLHGGTIGPRRVRRLAALLAPELPRGARILDVGAGDGKLAGAILALRPDLHIEGIDVLARADTAIQVRPFDGTTIPATDTSFDVVLLIDVVHHAELPEALIGECLRVTRTGVLIKDHLAETRLDSAILRAMDWVGNAGHGVRLPYNYWSTQGWARAIAAAGGTRRIVTTRLDLYPPPLTWVCDRHLHFIAWVTRGQGPR